MATNTSEPRRFRFTKTRLQGLPTPAAGRGYYHDDGCANLQLCITPAGTKTFYRYGKVAGRPVRVLLGRFPTMTVDEARKACSRVSGQVAEGKDPQAERLAVRREHTLQALYDHWMEFHAKSRKRTWAEDQRMFETFLRPWGPRRLSSIRKNDVQALHARVGRENGRYAANRLLGFIKAMYNKASDIGYTGKNPAEGVKRFSEEKRDRFLRADELPRFFQSLMTETSENVRDFFLVALLTGARRGNVQSMRWEDISFEAGVWRIPATKSGTPVVVPLVGPALRILSERYDARDGSVWVFPSWGTTGHLVEPKRAWRKICDRAGLTDVRVHDVRRTLGSWMTMGGTNLQMVGKMLGHTTPSATQVYARLELTPVRLAAEQATTAMLTAGGVLPPPQ